MDLWSPTEFEEIQMDDWNSQIIEEFRANDGKVAQFGDMPLVILRTIGARSGQVREVPLVALVEGDDLFVFASKGGAPTNPDWYHNLKAHPDIDVEYGSKRYRAHLRALTRELSTEKLQTLIDGAPQFAEYVTNAAPRIIPAFAIEPL